MGNGVVIIVQWRHQDPFQLFCSVICLHIVGQCIDVEERPSMYIHVHVYDTLVQEIFYRSGTGAGSQYMQCNMYTNTSK